MTLGTGAGCGGEAGSTSAVVGVSLSRSPSAARYEINDDNALQVSTQVRMCTESFEARRSSFG